MTVAVLMGLALVAGWSAPVAAEELDGKELFLNVGKCNMCHGVPAAGIEAKTKSEKMKGPDIEGLPKDVDVAALMKYLRKEAPLGESEHTKGFKGTDEELQAIIDWLGSLEAQE
jgi:cytochrome c5